MRVQFILIGTLQQVVIRVQFNKKVEAPVMKIDKSLLSVALMVVGCTMAMASPSSAPVPVAGMVVPTAAKAAVLNTTNTSQQIEISVALKPTSEAAFQAYVDEQSDPTSPLYKHWLTPEEVGQKFGASPKEVLGVVKFLQSNGIQVTLVAKNNLVVTGLCTVAQAEKAFGTSIVNYAGVDGQGKPITFYANTKPIMMPSAIAGQVLVVGGLTNYFRPITKTTLTPANARGLYGTAPSYASGFKGQGMSVGYANWDGYKTSNALKFISIFSLPTPAAGAGSNINIVEITSGNNNNNTNGAGEGDLDLQMELEVAPLANVYIYDDVNYQPLNTYTRMANDNICNTLSESYGWQDFGTSYDTAVHNEHLTMNGQGQTYMCASGDNETNDIQSYPWPDVDPNITVVGGTQATVDSNNQRTSELGWGVHIVNGQPDGEGSGGGWYASSFASPNINVLPTWQHGTGIPTNQSFRLFPDVALQAYDTGNCAFNVVYNNQLTCFAGTSCASPWFTGALATMEQRLIANGQSGRLGNINPMIYGQQGRSDVWYDVTQGPTDGTLPNGQTNVPTVGWDFVTGWGAPNFDGWYNAIATKIVDASGYTLSTGHLIAGNLASLSTVDTNYMQLQPGPTLSSKTPPIELVLNSTSPVASASNLEFDVTAHGYVHTVQTIELYNYSTGKYDLVSTVNVITSDQLVKVTAANADQYIQSGTNNIQARISYYASGPTLGFPWNEYVNQAIWKITP